MKVLAAELVEDFDLYPRESVDSTHVSDLAMVLRAGVDIPPVVADGKSKRIVDGIHRRRAFLKIYGDEAEIDCDFHEYKSQSEMYLEAIRLNAPHGKPIKGHDRTHALLRGIDLGIRPSALAAVFGITIEHVSKIVAIKAGTVSVATAKGKQIQRKIALKNSVHHMWGEDPRLTPEQAKIHESLPGTSQWLHIKQLSDLIEYEMLDWNNERVVAEMRRLLALLNDNQEKIA